MCYQNHPSSMQERFRYLRTGMWIVVAAMGCVLGPAQFAAAQAGARPAVDLKELDKTKKAVLGNRAPLRGNETKLADWYTQRLVAMARANEGVAQIRLELLTDLRAARNQEARVFVRSRLLEILPKLINSTKVGPPAKINGLLLLGELNDSEALLRGADPTPPVPSAVARRELMRVVASPNQKTAMKVAALVGLRRHVKLEMLNGGQRLGSDAATIVTMLTTILKTDPASPVERDGHHWMQRQAAEILGIFGTAGPNGDVATALDAIVRNDQLPNGLRCAGLNALARITMPAQLQQLNPDETVAAVGELAVATCQTEAARLQAWEDDQARRISVMGGEAFGGSREQVRRPPPPRDEPPRAGSRAGGRRGSRRNRRDEEPVDPESQYDTEPVEEFVDPGAVIVLSVRRRLKHELGCVRDSLSSDPAKGIRAMASSGKARTTVDRLGKQLDALLNALDATDVQPGDLRQTIENGSSAMAGLLAGGPKAAPAASGPPAATAVDPDSPF